MLALFVCFGFFLSGNMFYAPPPYFFSNLPVAFAVKGVHYVIIMYDSIPSTYFLLGIYPVSAYLCLLIKFLFFFVYLVGIYT